MKDFKIFKFRESIILEELFYDILWNVKLENINKNNIWKYKKRKRIRKYRGFIEDNFGWGNVLFWSYNFMFLEIRLYKMI